VNGFLRNPIITILKIELFINHFILPENMKSFSEKVYALTKKVPKGRVTTYKYVAKAMKTNAYRAVGQALRNNPYAPVVPCHRVVSSDGKIGGFAGQTQGKNIEKKIRLLRKEGVKIENKKIKDFERALFKF